MTEPRLAIVIHAEEEFDWDSGFFRSNNSVTHHEELIAVIDRIFELGAKVTLAMDYPFVTSAGGRAVIDLYRSLAGDKVEFATHLHPWVNPPYEDDKDLVPAEFSYPCNLPAELEREKLRVLTDKIQSTTGTRPLTYLAGRYGIGKNTASILSDLGYKSDVSISAYCDFSHQHGPDFSMFTNRSFEENQITYIPHTSSVLALLPFVGRYLNENPERLTQLQQTRARRLVCKFLRVRKYRLSPEGFTFSHMKEVTESQMKLGQRDFILSFHSPSSKPGMTPYVRSYEELESFKKHLDNYIDWFNSIKSSEFFLPGEMANNPE